MHPRRGTLALCDGASEGWDSGRWAGRLARELARGGPCGAAILRARREFMRTRPERGDWLTERARQRGSWATALVVEIGSGGRSLRASAIGDTTLFVLDGYDTVFSFPVEDPGGYSSTPELIGDDVEALPEFRRIIVRLAGLRRPSFALATDAIAAKVLAAHASERRELWRFFGTASAAVFDAWACRGMTTGSLVRDDLTVLWVR